MPLEDSTHKEAMKKMRMAMVSKESAANNSDFDKS